MHYTKEYRNLDKMIKDYINIGQFGQFGAFTQNIFNYLSKYNFNELRQPILGIKSPNNENYLIQFTCKICNTKMTRIFTKHAYHNGIVIIKCDGCKGNHLIADNLGWFSEANNKKDDKFNIETILKNLNQNYIKKDLQGLLEIVKYDNQFKKI